VVQALPTAHRQVPRGQRTQESPTSRNTAASCCDTLNRSRMATPEGPGTTNDAAT
jgi:hypothetical protein